MSSSTAPRLVIVGRPNVGKSTLFNRLYGRKRALVHDEPGVTRDRLELSAEWLVRGKKYPVSLVDTGGLGGDRFADEIAKQVNLALSDADLVIVLFDGQAGFTSADAEVIQQIKRSGLATRVPLIGAVNKVDADVHETFINDFFQSNLDPLITLSAEHARGINDLQELVHDVLKERGFKDVTAPEVETSEPIENEEEEMLEFLSDEQGAQDGIDETGETNESTEEDLLEASPTEFIDITADQEDVPEDLLEESEEVSEEPQYERKVPRVAIIGRPNVGKSTLTNALLREDRMITSPVAGTTVDAVDSYTELNGNPFVLIDTAGIRRKSKTEQGVEVLSVIQSRKALERCDVALLLIDGEVGVTDQDEKIGSLIEEVGCGVVLIVNKWDLQKRNREFTKEMAAKHIRDEMGYLRYAPVLFISAKNRQGLEGLGDLIDEIIRQRRVKVGTHEFTEWVRAESEIHNPGNAKFYMSHQSGRNPPTFVCHVSKPDKVHFSLRRHLVNAIRDRWGFMGSPLRLVFVEGKSRKGPPPRKTAHGSLRKRVASSASSSQSSAKSSPKTFTR